MWTKVVRISELARELVSVQPTITLPRKVLKKSRQEKNRTVQMSQDDPILAKLLLELEEESNITKTSKEKGSSVKMQKPTESNAAQKSLLAAEGEGPQVLAGLVQAADVQGRQYQI